MAPLVIGESKGSAHSGPSGPLGLGTLYQKFDQREQAQAELVIACEQHRAMAMTWWLQTAESALMG